MKMADTLKRVKLYSLDVDKVWVDKGTGRIISTVSDNKQYFLKIFSEVDESVLMDLEILADVSFEKQQETLILWCDRNDEEFALSFQDKQGCDAIWKVICNAQEKISNLSKGLVVYDSDGAEDNSTSDFSITQDLPPIEVNCLQEISDIIHKFKTSACTEKLSSMLLKGNYVVKLLDMFQLCETQNNREALATLSDIFKRIVTLSNIAIFEEIFKKDRIFDVVGCFEYDKSKCFPNQHRDFINQKVKYKEVSSSLNPELLDKIHQTYRVQYIQDVILPSINALEESILLSPFLYHNKVSIVTMIQGDILFLTELFEILENSDTDNTKRRNILLFLKELFIFAQNLQPSARNSFYKDLIELKIVHALQTSLQVDNADIKLAVIEVLNFFVEYSPALIRKYMLEQTNEMSLSVPLIILLVNSIVNESDNEYGCSMHVLALLKLLLHPDNMESTVNKSDKTDFLNYFYENALDLIIEPIFIDINNNYSLVIILELLEFCVEHHSYHIRNVILHKDLVRHILKLMKSPSKVLCLSALRFLRKVIALKDEFYNRYIVTGDLLAPVVEAFLKNEGRYNMLDSAILETFELIRLEEIKSLCSYIVERFATVLDDVKYVQTFKSLKSTYEQNCLRSKEKNVPMYLQNCFKNSEETWCCGVKYDFYSDEEESKNEITEKRLINGDYRCAEMDVQLSERDTMKRISSSSPRLQSIIGDQSPIFRRVRRSKLSSSDLIFKNSQKRVVEYDSDEEEEDNETKAGFKNQSFSLGRCKRLCLNLP